MRDAGTALVPPAALVCLDCDLEKSMGERNALSGIMPSKRDARLAWGFLATGDWL